MKCLCCERGIEIVDIGDDSHGILPNIVGGHLVISITYGSRVHDCCDHYDTVQHQAVICDACLTVKAGLIRTVEVARPVRFVESEQHRIGNGHED